MDQATKNMIVDSIIKVVENAPNRPVKHYFSYQSYAGSHPYPYHITPQQFQNWVNYIISVLKIVSSYVDVMVCVSSINNIVMQQNDNYNKKTNDICQILLDFARSVLNM